MTRLEVGQLAPDFTLESTQGPVTLSTEAASADKGVVVYFYPKAATPGCTTEACDFRDNLNTLKGAGYTVIGISADTIPELEAFATDQHLNFPLASDPHHAVIDAWGVWGEKNRYGHVSLGIIRSTFVVGRDRRVAVAQYNVQATGHVARLRRDLGVDAA